MISNPSASKLVVGIDLDNTLVTYDDLIHEVALGMNLITTGVRPNKTEIRDHVRRLPDGEIKWQRLQAIIYGPRMCGASISNGTLSFFQECKRQSAKVFVISHKTQFAKYDTTNTDLHKSAMKWMTYKRFFDADGFSLKRDDVFMEPTRQDKLHRVAELGCRYFVDDLQEIFLEPNFPIGVQGILYHPNAKQSCPSGVKPATCWREIQEHIFGT